MKKWQVDYEYQPSPGRYLDEETVEAETEEDAEQIMVDKLSTEYGENEYEILSVTEKEKE